MYTIKLNIARKVYNTIMLVGVLKRNYKVHTHTNYCIRTIQQKAKRQICFQIRTAMRCSCLIRKIIPEHCTILKTTFEEISFWPWKCQISFKITKIIIYVIIVEFCKGGSQMRGRLILYVRVAFTCFSISNYQAHLPI